MADQTQQTQQSMYNEVFISYSRANSDFAKRIVDAIYAKGYENIWIDWEDIEYAEDWWRRIQNGIESADNFLFLITPDSIQSEVCYDEVDYAAKSGKRIIPILHQEIPRDLMEQMHPTLSRHNWLPFRNQDDFDAGIESLFQTINADLAHVRIHTRLLTRARDWDDDERKQTRLLTPGELDDIKKWLEVSDTNLKSPRPTNLQREYVRESERYYRRRRFTVILPVALIFLIAFFVAGSAFVIQNQTRESVATANIASTDVARAFNEVATAQMNLDLAQADAATAQSDAATSESVISTAENEAIELIATADGAQTEVNDAFSNLATAQAESTNAINRANSAEAEAQQVGQQAQEAQQVALATAKIGEMTATAQVDRAARLIIQSDFVPGFGGWQQFVDLSESNNSAANDLYVEFLPSEDEGNGYMRMDFPDRVNRISYTNQTILPSMIEVEARFRLETTSNEQESRFQVLIGDNTSWQLRVGLRSGNRPNLRVHDATNSEIEDLINEINTDSIPTLSTGVWYELHVIHVNGYITMQLDNVTIYRTAVTIPETITFSEISLRLVGSQSIADIDYLNVLRTQ